MKENLRPWDGTTPESWHTYPVENSPNPLLIDDGGTIWYRDSAGTLAIWCPRSRLRYHLHRLFQRGGDCVIFFPFLIVWKAAGASWKRGRRRRY